MSTTLAPPSAWTIPHPTPERQLVQIRAQYPDALAWYGERSGLWLAAPSGADRLVQARTPARLAYLLEEHYKRFLSQTSRPAHPQQRQTQRRGPGGDQPLRPIRTARSRPAGGGSITPAPGHGQARERRGGRFRRAMAGLGLVADAA